MSNDAPRRRHRRRRVACRVRNAKRSAVSTRSIVGLSRRLEQRHGEQTHGRVGQSARDRSGPRDSARRWQRGRRGDRDSDGVDVGRAAKLGHWRRRVSDALGWPQGRRLRRPRNCADGSRRKTVPAARRQADAVLRRRGRRPLGRHAGRGAHAGGRAQAVRKAAVGAVVRARDPAWQKADFRCRRGSTCSSAPKNI